MKRKYLIIAGTLILISIIPTIVLGADNSSDLLKLIKGDGAFEQWFMKAFATLDKEIADMAESGSILGRAIGGLGALFTLAYMGFQMQSGDREWEIMPMFRPLFVGLILIYWTSFYQLIQYPFQKLAEPSIAFFTDIEKEADDLRVTRFTKQMALVDFLIKKEAEQEIKEAQASWVPGSETFAEIKMAIKEWSMKMEYKTQKFFSEIFEAVGLTILRFGTYLVFFIQKMWVYVLTILGPIAIGMALIPGFEASMNSWIAKFINVNLFTFIAYSIINLGQVLIMSSYKMEISRLNLMMDSNNIITTKGEALIPTYLEGSGLMYSVLFTVVAYLITGIGVLLTPTIADSIVAAGGAGIMTKMKGAAAKTGIGIRGAGKAASISGGNVAKSFRNKTITPKF